MVLIKKGPVVSAQQHSMDEFTKSKSSISSTFIETVAVKAEGIFTSIVVLRIKAISFYPSLYSHLSLQEYILLCIIIQLYCIPESHLSNKTIKLWKAESLDDFAGLCQNTWCSTGTSWVQKQPLY